MQPRGRKRVTVGIGGIAALAVAVSLSACSSNNAPSGGSSPTAAALTGTLNGSGSTFQTVFQQAAISAFKAVQPSMTVNYGSGGSGKGRSDLASNVVNYAGSDSPIPSNETANFSGKPTVLYFPVLIGPITMSYNLPNVSTLKLTPTIIANIFQGKTTTWNDPSIAAANPGVTLPPTPITIAVRSDSSGTTQNFSLFLQTAVPSVWTLGSSSTISWPHSAHAGSGNSGVAQIVKSTPGAIGYVDYADAKASGLKWASVENSSGKFVEPSAAAASASAAGVTVNPDLTFHAVWGTSAAAYPITYQSWVLVYDKQSSANVAKMLQAWLAYLLGDGQKLLPQLGYAELPASIDQMAKAQLTKITS
jgi:phosphate transport system substrate-binding protein